jgi:hypothetical protein
MNRLFCIVRDFPELFATVLTFARMQITIPIARIDQRVEVLAGLTMVLRDDLMAQFDGPVNIGPPMVRNDAPDAGV